MKDVILQKLLSSSDLLVDKNFKSKIEENRNKKAQEKGDLRLPMIGSSDEIKKKLRSILGKVTVESISKGDRLNGAKSGKFETFKITSGDTEVFVVNKKVSEKSDVAQKELSPDALGFGGKIYSAKEIYTFGKQALHQNCSNVVVRDFAINLLESVKASKSLSLIPILNNVETPHDTQNIFNDFGEILSAFIVARTFNEKAEFPGISNEKIFDFKMGDERYSAKNQGGANNSIDNLYDELNKNGIILKTNTYRFLKIVRETSPKSMATLRAAKMLDTEGFRILKDLVDFDLTDVKQTQKLLREYLDKLYKIYGNDVITEKNKELFSLYKVCTPKKNPDMNTFLAMLKSKDPLRFGYLTYPIFANLVREFNSVDKNVAELTAIFNMISYKQIYLNPKKKGFLEFKIINSEDSKVKLSTKGPYAAKPNNTGIKYEVIK